MAAEQKIVFQVVERIQYSEEYHVIFESESESDADAHCLQLRQMGWGRPFVEKTVLPTEREVVTMNEDDTRLGWDRSRAASVCAGLRRGLIHDRLYLNQLSENGLLLRKISIRFSLQKLFHDWRKASNMAFGERSSAFPDDR